MRRILALLILLLAALPAYGQKSTPLRIKEVDGSPSVANATVLVVPNGSISASGGTVTLSFTAPSGNPQVNSLGVGVAAPNITGQITAAGAVFNGGVSLTQLAIPSAPTVTCAGACAGGTWAYKVTALDRNGFETTASSAGSATNATTLTSTNKNVISWAAITNAVSYNVYRTTSAGTPANQSLVCSATSSLSCTDDGSVNTASVIAPTTNATGALVLPLCTVDKIQVGNFQIGGVSNGQRGVGFCWDSNGTFWFFNPGHEPSYAYGSNGMVFKWSEHLTWSPNGTFQDAGQGVSLAGDIGNGFDSVPGILDVGWNAVTNDTRSYVGSAGSVKTFTATAALTAGQVVKVDSANDDSVVVAATSDTGGGIAIGVVLNAPGDGGTAYVLLNGRTPLAVLGTGTCTKGQFVIVDTTTAGRVKCTGTFTAGTVIGTALTSQASVGSAVAVLVQPK